MRRRAQCGLAGRFPGVYDRLPDRERPARPYRRPAEGGQDDGPEDLAEKRLCPAIDAVASGTRRDDLLMDPAEHAAVTKLRRALAALDPQHAIGLLIDKTKTDIPNGSWLLRSAPGGSPRS